MVLQPCPCFSTGVPACFCDPRHHCPCLSVDKDLAVLNLTFCPSPPCGEKLDVFAAEAWDCLWGGNLPHFCLLS